MPPVNRLSFRNEREALQHELVYAFEQIEHLKGKRAQAYHAQQVAKGECGAENTAAVTFREKCLEIEAATEAILATQAEKLRMEEQQVENQRDNVATLEQQLDIQSKQVASFEVELQAQKASAKHQLEQRGKTSLLCNEVQDALSSAESETDRILQKAFTFRSEANALRAKAAAFNSDAANQEDSDAAQKHRRELTELEAELNSTEDGCSTALLAAYREECVDQSEEVEQALRALQKTEQVLSEEHRDEAAVAQAALAHAKDKRDAELVSLNIMTTEVQDEVSQTRALAFQKRESEQEQRHCATEMRVAAKNLEDAKTKHETSLSDLEEAQAVFNACRADQEKLKENCSNVEKNCQGACAAATVARQNARLALEERNQYVRAINQSETVRAEAAEAAGFELTAMEKEIHELKEVLREQAEVELVLCAELRDAQPGLKVVQKLSGEIERLVDRVQGLREHRDEWAAKAEEFQQSLANPRANPRASASCTKQRSSVGPSASPARRGASSPSPSRGNSPTGHAGGESREGSHTSGRRESSARKSGTPRLPQVTGPGTPRRSNGR